MGVDLGGVEFYTGPTVLGGPDDLEAVVLDFIGGAKKVLLIAVQALDSRPVAEAILTAKSAGVRIQLILEGNYLTRTRRSTSRGSRAGPTRSTARSTPPCCGPGSTSSPT